MKTKTILLLALTICFGITNSYAKDCQQAQKDYEKALSAGNNDNWQEAKKWLTKSVNKCNKFQYWYRLGQADQELKNYSDAASAYIDAIQYSNKSNQYALAAGRYAQIESLEGRDTEALTLLHKARQMHSNPPDWMTALARQLDLKRIKKPLTVAQVTKGLNNKGIKLLNMDAKPNINITINFNTDSTVPVKASLASIDILAKALVDNTLAGKNFMIVGHADERGGDQYNQELSEKRAQKIAAKLIERQPSLKNRLVTNGKGEKAPLYKGTTNKDYLLNRRIEVQVN